MQIPLFRWLYEPRPPFWWFFRMGFVLPPLPPGGLSNLDTPTIGALTALRSQPLVWMFHGLWRARAPRHALTGWVSDLGGNRPKPSYPSWSQKIPRKELIQTLKQGEAGWSRHVSLRQDKSPKACQKLCQNKCWHKCHEVEQFVISWAIQGQENSGALYLYLGVSCPTSHHWALALAALV